jgi:exopolysaccharide biosynthesis polyprenyl glycosylphosphotransferase
VRPAATRAAPRRRWLSAGIRPLAGIEFTACLLAGVVVGSPWWITVPAAVILVATLAFGGLYRSRLTLSVLSDLPAIAARSLAALAVGLVALGLSLGGDGWFWPSERDAVVFTVVAAAFVLLARTAAYWAIRELRSRRVIAHRTLVVGSGDIGQRIADTLTTRPEYGLLPIGFVDTNRRAARDLPLPVLGTTDELAEALDLPDLRAVVLAYGRLPETELVDLIRACHRHSYEVFVVPRLYELHHVARDMELVWGMPLVRLRRAAYRTAAWRLKRLGDVLVAALAIVALSPLLLAVAAGVRLEGGPGVIFRQRRVGCDGRTFELLKFRSMRPADETESAQQWSISQDHRVGRVGRFLRVTSLDELPQLFNILRGDMSVVGPRPERPHFVEEFRELYPSYSARLRVPCGLTGWAQVHGLRGDTSIEDRARFDNFYIENWSLGLDLKIVLMTLVSVVRSPGS